ncbi:MAG: zinc-binding dehydrogenase [Bacteroidales bacterium]
MKKKDIPERMMAPVQHGPGEPLIMEEVPVPRPGPGEVLVEMAAAPINPSDLATLKGGYVDWPYPLIPGLEGSGRVVATGGGFVASLRAGKQVACSPGKKGGGTWAPYLCTSAMQCVPLPPSVTPIQGSTMLVNPMTALAFLHLATTGRHRAVINTAAASNLGKMLLRLGQDRNLPMIHIVRREEQRQTLKDLGASHVLMSTAEGFAGQLKELSHSLGASLILDAVGGELGGTLLAQAPAGSTLVAYARLSGENLQIRPSDLIQENKTIRGFQLAQWLSTQSLPFKLRLSGQVRKLLPTLLTTDIHREFPPDQANEAMELYRASMSSGKIILVHGGPSESIQPKSM